MNSSKATQSAKDATSERHRKAAMMRHHCECRRDPDIRECVFGDCLIYHPELWNDATAKLAAQVTWEAFKEMLDAK